ncbi:MAG: hypothetical protein LCH86_12410 [Proteobacteria bacterium]|nr:hypothetical protein [Pseudomonadota bacterium]
MISTENAFYYVVDERLVDMAFILAGQINDIWKQDVHIFVESSGGSQGVGERRQRPGVYYHDNLLTPFLPKNLPESGKWPAIVYLRVFAPSFLKNYKRLIYLDVDILPVRAEERIWDLDLNGSLGAVHDYEVTHNSPVRGMTRQGWLESIGVFGGRYFNSGVLVLDTKSWCTIDFASALEEFARKYRRGMKMFDQDFLNCYFQDTWKELSPGWNYQASIFSQGLDRVSSPVFIHFSKPDKPWKGRFCSDVLDIDNIGNEFLRRLAANASIDISFHIDPVRHSYFTVKKLNLRRSLSKLGVTTKKERKLRREWDLRRQNLAEYLERARNDGRFADGWNVTNRPLDCRPVFDGKTLRLPVPEDVVAMLGDTKG